MNRDCRRRTALAVAVLVGLVGCAGLAGPNVTLSQEQLQSQSTASFRASSGCSRSSTSTSLDPRCACCPSATALPPTSTSARPTAVGRTVRGSLALDYALRFEAQRCQRAPGAGACAGRQARPRQRAAVAVERARRRVAGRAPARRFRALPRRCAAAEADQRLGVTAADIVVTSRASRSGLPSRGNSPACPRRRGQPSRARYHPPLRRCIQIAWHNRSCRGVDGAGQGRGDGHRRGLTEFLPISSTGH